jgi:hypothetical protein
MPSSCFDGSASELNPVGCHLKRELATRFNQPPFTDAAIPAGDARMILQGWEKAASLTNRGRR